MLLVGIMRFTGHAQEKYGNTLNLGLGIGYYGYTGSSAPVLSANYEFDVFKNFTLAPFIMYYSFKKDYVYVDGNNRWRDDVYHDTFVPFGVKGTYYFDDLLGASPKWDFYLGASLGIQIESSSIGIDNIHNDNYYNQASTLYLDFHIGTEYHLSSHIGIFLDLSTGVSTVGLAIH